MVANLAIQQPSLCLVCGLSHVILQREKEEVRLNAEATKQGGKFPGTDKSACRNFPQQKQECEERTDKHYGSSSGCFMCFALGNPEWAYHIPEKCWSKDKFDKSLQSAEAYIQ